MFSGIYWNQPVCSSVWVKILVSFKCWQEYKVTFIDFSLECPMYQIRLHGKYDIPKAFSLPPPPPTPNIMWILICYLIGKKLKALCNDINLIFIKTKSLPTKPLLSHSHTMTPFDAPGKQAF